MMTEDTKVIYSAKEPVSESVTELTSHELTEVSPSRVPRDMVLSYIVSIDEHLVGLEQESKDLRAVKSALIGRAISEDITEDARAYVEKVVGKNYRNEIQGELLVKFKEIFPLQYEGIRKKQVIELNDKLTERLHSLPNAEIPLSIADKEIGKVEVTAFTGYKPQTVSIEVRKKQLVLK